MKNKDESRKQLVDALKSAENILVTVNANPSVDELSAALGLALVLDKLDKHATAVFSGKIPPAIKFLSPEKTFEDTTHSLQDFIIALDKEKADHLRYKVEGDMVKIFITPYRTVINENDLEFSQGDYNVETIVTIGAQSVDDLDKALADHGRIMHDAKVASISIGDLESQIGSINIRVRDASSYGEVVANLAEDLRDNKSLLDEQSATAILTGIVAATERFSNEHTTAESMTIAAQLMAAGANQQLIATHLDDAASSDGNDDNDDDRPRDMEEDSSPDDERSPDDVPAADGSISISHSKGVDKKPIEEQPGTDEVDIIANEVAEQNNEAAANAAELQLDQFATNESAISPEEEVAENELSQHLDALAGSMEQPNIADELKVEPSAQRTEAAEPSFGGVLNATTEEAADDTRLTEEEDRNRQLLTHANSDYVDSAAAPQSAVNSFNQQSADSEPVVSDIFGGAAPTEQAAPLQPLDTRLTSPDTSGVTPAVETFVPPTPAAGQVDQFGVPIAPAQGVYTTPAPTDAVNSSEALSAAFDAATPAAPVMPTNDTFAAGLPPLPPMPDFSTLPPLPPLPGETTPIAQSSFMSPEPNFTPPQGTMYLEGAAPDQMVDSLLPPLPDTQTETPLPSSQPQPNDPAQFRIPGQS